MERPSTGMVRNSELAPEGLGLIRGHPVCFLVQAIEGLGCRDSR